MHVVLPFAWIYLRIPRWSLILKADTRFNWMRFFFLEEMSRCHFWRFLILIGAATCVFELKCKTPKVDRSWVWNAAPIKTGIDLLFGAQFFKRKRNGKCGRRVISNNTEMKFYQATASRWSGRHKERKCRCTHTLHSGRVWLCVIRQNHFTFFLSLSFI